MTHNSRVRDPVHNFIHLRDVEIKLLGTPLLQRLRGIRQLAMANLVYPGALHTRFDHTLGVCHVAGMMAERLELNANDTELVRLAALLHDLGHGPFSHVSEYALEIYADRNVLPAEQKKEKIHEVITAHLIRNDQNIQRYISEDRRNQIVQLLSTGHGAPILRSIVSGPLDADKQDYLLRDSRFCGVQYGVFDLHQLHRSMVKVGNADEHELMISPDGVHALEQFVLAKYYLTTNVYRHRVRLISDQMIVRAILLGIEVDELAELRALYSFDGTPAFFDRFVSQNDMRFLYQFDSTAKPGTKCGDLLTRLQERRLHKRVFSARIQEFARPEVRQALQDVSKPRCRDLRSRIESAVSEKIAAVTGTPLDSDLVIVHGFDIKSVRTSSRNDEASIMIQRQPEPIPFEEDSTLFVSIDEGFTDGYVEVYAPISWSSPTARVRRLREIEQPVREAVERATTEGIG